MASSSPDEAVSSPRNTMASTVSRPLFMEDSPTPSPVREAMRRSFPRINETQSSPAPDHTGNDGNVDSGDGSDESVRRPVGRAARRMMGDEKSPSRVRSPPMASSAAKSVNAPAAESDDELYSSTPMIARKLKSLSPPASQARSTLFVSPTKTSQDASDDGLPADPFAGTQSKLAALVAEKRAERLAREAEEEGRRNAQAVSAHATSDLPDEILEGSQEPVNPDVERIMSDAAKPTRKASRKALLEMERETQRIARQQALAHQTKVRKKFTTSDLFARFNFRQTNEQQPPAASDGDNTTSSVPNSDAAEARPREPVSTPPSSPPTPLDRQRALVEQGALSKMVSVRQDSIASVAEADSEGELPDMARLLSSAPAPLLYPSDAQITQRSSEVKRGLKLARLGKKATATIFDQDSDDDLEIVQSMPGHLSVFDRAKGSMKRQNTDSKAIHTLKHLSHLGTDAGYTGRRKKGACRLSVNPEALEVQLRLRAKQQARAQHLERIAELKAKGIDIQTAEERERELEEYENLLEKARKDAVELRKAEKAASKANGVDTEGNEIASDDESEDEDYIESGSEEEEAQGVDENGNELLDDAAAESEDEESDDGTIEEEVEDETTATDQNLAKDLDHENDTTEDAVSAQSLESLPVSQTFFVGRKPRKSRVITDDDDESDVEAAHQLANNTPAASDATDATDPFAAFGFGSAKQGSSLMSPTQAFNATMQTPTQATQQDSLDILRHLVPPSSSSLPPFEFETRLRTQDDSQVSMVPVSQVSESQQVNLLWETQAPETPVTGINRGGSSLTDTPGWLPTQDAGLPATWQDHSGLAGDEHESSIADDGTQDTVRIRISESPAPLPKRKRLVRGQRSLIDSSDEEAESVARPMAAKKDAFREMARKRKEAMSAAELADAEREAKLMMDEQAEESEDEYAGLGGDDYVAPETEQDREMIDSSRIDVDERQLAAHFAERQRVADEEQANKLYKDLMTGGLRRKQANMFDLDDDEDEIAVRRRQMRQREEARKRKLLLQDDNIAGLAEGKQSKGKDAFLKAIADDDERDDDALDLSDVEEEPPSYSQADSQPSQQIDDSAAALREISGNKRKHDDGSEERPPAKQRRTQASAFRAPTSMLELKESVSFLLDEPHTVSVGPSVLELSSDSESDYGEAMDGDEEEPDPNDNAVEVEQSRQNDGGYAPDRELMPPPRLPASQRRTAAKASVVDRLSLKRGASNPDSAQSRTAWAAPANGGFKVPSLLRRATTNNTAFGANERGVTTSTGVSGLSRENSGSGSGSGVKMGGTKKSSLAYQARDAERKAIVEASAKRRAENTARIAQLRRNASSGFGKGLGGQFE